MPKFKWGAPQVTFKRRNGKKFTNTYHSRGAAAKSARAWRAKGGKVVKTGSLGVKGKSVLRSKSGKTMKSGRATRGNSWTW